MFEIPGQGFFEHTSGLEEYDEDNMPLQIVKGPKEECPNCNGPVDEIIHVVSRAMVERFCFVCWKCKLVFRTLEKPAKAPE